MEFKYNEVLIKQDILYRFFHWEKNPIESRILSFLRKASIYSLIQITLLEISVLNFHYM